MGSTVGGGGGGGDVVVSTFMFLTHRAVVIQCT